MRATRWVVGLGTALALISPAAAQAAAFPVNPGPAVAGRTIIGSGQNLPPISDSTYNVGSYMAPQVEAYYTGQAIERDRSDVALAAWRFVRDWTRDRCGAAPEQVRDCKAMVVFDVDETLLIPQTRDLFNRVKKLGVSIALVSSGDRDTKASMVSCLNARGINGWDRYIMRGDKDPAASSAEYKALARESLKRDGFTIVASVGDQVSDMSYGHLKRGFLLPNTMYYMH